MFSSEKQRPCTKTRLQDLQPQEERTTWSSLKDIVDAIFNGTANEPGIDELYVKDASQLTEKECRTFQGYIMAVLFYRTGQRPEWLKHFTHDDWEGCLTMRGGNYVLNLERNKTELSKTFAQSHVDEIIGKYFDHSLNHVRKRFLTLLRLTASRTAHGCLNCKINSFKSVPLISSNPHQLQRQAFTTYHAFLTKSCRPFQTNPLHDQLPKLYGVSKKTSTLARHVIETQSRNPELGITTEELDHLADALNHSKTTAEARYVNFARIYEATDQTVVKIRKKLDEFAAVVSVEKRTPTKRRSQVLDDHTT